MPNDLLWHYCGFDALLGIIEKKKLWASNIAYLNDTAEFKHALRLAMDIADTLPENRYGIKSAIPNYGMRAGCRTYVTCFSTKADDLSQWRAYAQPPPGFAIGFDRPTLEAVAVFQGFKLVECEYDIAKQKPPLEVVLQSHLRDLNANPLFNPTWGTKAGMYLSTSYNPRLGTAIADLAVRFKAPEFKEEGEVRAIWPAQQKSVPDPIKAKFRQSRTMVVPYIEWDAALAGEPLPIKYILVGPGPHSADVVSATRMLWEQHYMHQYAPIEPSAIPFRNW
jgi:Protein of unknown function (DUF2971)